MYVSIFFIEPAKQTFLVVLCACIGFSFMINAINFAMITSNQMLENNIDIATLSRTVLDPLSCSIGELEHDAIGHVDHLEWYSYK